MFAVSALILCVASDLTSQRSFKIFCRFLRSCSCHWIATLTFRISLSLFASRAAFRPGLATRWLMLGWMEWQTGLSSHGLVVIMGYPRRMAPNESIEVHKIRRTAHQTNSRQRLGGHRRQNFAVPKQMTSCRDTSNPQSPYQHHDFHHGVAAAASALPLL